MSGHYTLLYVSVRAIIMEQIEGVSHLTVTVPPELVERNDAVFKKVMIRGV